MYTFVTGVSQMSARDRVDRMYMCISAAVCRPRMFMYTLYIQIRELCLFLLKLLIPVISCIRLGLRSMAFVFKLDLSYILGYYKLEFFVLSFYLNFDFYCNLHDPNAYFNLVPKISYFDLRFLFLIHDTKLTFVECALVLDLRVYVKFFVKLVQPSKCLLYSRSSIYIAQ